MFHRGDSSQMTESKRTSNIKYINPKKIHVELPSYSGERYEAMVPDTLDIQERAVLAVHGLTSTTDPDSDYEIYWAALLNRNPVYMFHSWNDTCWSKYVDTLPLLRLASGSTLNMHVEHRWLEVLLHMQGTDGLFYFPKTGKPWWPNQCYGPAPPGKYYPYYQREKYRKNQVHWKNIQRFVSVDVLPYP